MSGTLSDGTPVSSEAAASTTTNASNGNASNGSVAPQAMSAVGAGVSSASRSAFQTLTVDRVREDLLSLYERIACEKGRVEIINGDGGCACVLISKAELDSLEEALDMLSDDDGVKAMRDCLARFADGVDDADGQRVA